MKKVLFSLVAMLGIFVSCSKDDLGEATAPQIPEASVEKNVTPDSQILVGTIRLNPEAASSYTLGIGQSVTFTIETWTGIRWEQVTRSHEAYISNTSAYELWDGDSFVRVVKKAAGSATLRIIAQNTITIQFY